MTRQPVCCWCRAGCLTYAYFSAITEILCYFNSMNKAKLQIYISKDIIFNKIVQSARKFTALIYSLNITWLIKYVQECFWLLLRHSRIQNLIRAFLQMYKPVLVKQFVPGDKSHGTDYEGWEYTSHGLWKKKLIWKPFWKKYWKPGNKQVWIKGMYQIFFPESSAKQSKVI